MQEPAFDTLEFGGEGGGDVRGYEMGAAAQGREDERVLGVCC